MTTAVAAAAVAALTLAALPAIGQPLEGAGGIYAGCITNAAGQISAVVLLPDAPAEAMTWQAAVDWAQGLGAELPTRPVAAMLFANVRGQFERDWYWTSEVVEWNGACAWGQDFDGGHQDDDRKSYEGRCRAVRLIHLVP